MFSPSWPSVRTRIWGTHAACVSLLPPYLLFPSVSPSDFLATPTWLFISTWSLGKHSELPLGPGLSAIFKSLKDQKLSWLSKESPSNCAYLIGGEGTKLPPLLNILKNSLLTSPVSQGGEGPCFPHSCKFPEPFTFFCWDKDLPSHQRDNPRFLSAELPLISESIWTLFDL